MRLKHVLFGGLFLTVGFAACTNDDFTEVQTPSVSAENALSLGEGYTITGSRAVADPTTKSIFEVADGALMPYWETTDVIGAAWYGALAEDDFNEDGTIKNTYTAAAPNSTYDFASNTGFSYLEQVGDKYHARFKATNNVMAGAYVLYYPFDKSITTLTDKITVKRDFSDVTYNCAEGHEFDGINDRMFSYGEAAFTGGVETGNFTLRQVPVVFRLNFGAENLQLVSGQTLTIDRVIMEAYSTTTIDKDNSVLAVEGEVTAPAAPGAADYNSYLAYVAGDEDGEPLPEADYKSTETVGHYTIVVEGGDNADYQIQGLNKATEGSIIFSALPFTKEAKLVIVKIVTDQGIVLSKEYTKAADLAVFNAATEEGALVKTTVMVDTQTQDNTIYTVDQFNTQWDAAVKAGKGTLLIADPILLEDVTLTCNTANANITINSEDNATLSIAGINMQNGSLTINSGVKVSGDIVTTGDSDLTINGEVSAQDITLSGDAAINEVTEMASLTVGQSGVVELTLPNDKAKVGAITINQGGQLTLNGGAINGYENNGGTLTLADEVTNYGTFEGAVATTGNGKFINAKGATATFNVTTGQTGVTVENEAGATINIEMPEAYTSGWTNVFVLENGSSNDGTINVKKGQLITNQTFTQNEDARIYVEKDGMLNLNSNSLDGWVVMNDAAAKLENTTNANVAYSVKKTADLGTVPSGVTNIFIDADLKITTGASVPSGNVYVNASQTLGADFTTPGHTYFVGNVTLSGTGTFSASGANNSGNLYIDGVLTLGDNVTLSYYNMPDATDMANIRAKDASKQVVKKQ